MFSEKRLSKVKRNLLLCHEIDWNNVEIIDVARSNMHLLWKEMLHIYKDKPTMNKQLKSELFCLLIGQKTKDNI